MTDTGKKIGNVELDDLERKYQFSLPEEYRNFLRTNNGGHPTPEAFSARYNDGSERESIIDYFFEVGTKGPYIIDSTINNLQVLDQRISRDVIPIANTPFGDLICLGVKGKAAGKVFFWNLEDDEDNAPVEDLGLIANSFQEFIDSLYDPE